MPDHEDAEAGKPRPPHARNIIVIWTIVVALLLVGGGIATAIIQSRAQQSADALASALASAEDADQDLVRKAEGLPEAIAAGQKTQGEAAGILPEDHPALIKLRTTLDVAVNLQRQVEQLPAVKSDTLAGADGIRQDILSLTDLLPDALKDLKKSTKAATRAVQEATLAAARTEYDAKHGTLQAVLTEGEQLWVSSEDRVWYTSSRDDLRAALDRAGQVLAAPADRYSVQALRSATAAEVEQTARVRAEIDKVTDAIVR